jgi:hypothetical protein
MSYESYITKMDTFIYFLMPVRINEVIRLYKLCAGNSKVQGLP